MFGVSPEIHCEALQSTVPQHCSTLETTRSKESNRHIVWLGLGVIDENSDSLLK